MSTKMRSGLSIRSYLEYLLKSPITIWWAAATFSVEVLSFVIVGNTITIAREWLVIMVFIVSFSLFVGLLVLYKGWAIYSQAYDQISVSEITQADYEQVFVLESWRDLPVGSILEVHRTRESVEITIGFIETTLQRADGKIQAKPIWIMPVHLRDIKARSLSVQNITVCRTLSNAALSRWVDGLVETKVQDLIRRGTEG
jgi:hypothetical protein